MAVITPSTFDPLDTYVRTRLAQGVPIVDADVNEREDIDMFELRAFLKWFVGDGVPEGNDGFRIAESATKANNFLISAGAQVGPGPLPTTRPERERYGLGNAGRCLVNGLDAMIAENVEFTSQVLLDTNPNIATVELKLGSPRILTTALNAATAGTLHVWLDVWHAVVTPTDDPTLILAGLGTESCSRERRYWAVRVRGGATGATAPVAGDPEFAPGHSYYRIATLTRRAGDPSVNAADITDLREQRLLVPPSTIFQDLFGLPVLDYRRGMGRPPISFRDAINALIRGAIPGTPEMAIAPAPANNDVISRGIFVQGSSIVVTWHSDRLGGNQIFAATLNLANVGAGFSAAHPLTSGTDHASGHVVPLLGGNLFLVCEAGATLTEHVKFRRGPLTGAGAIVGVADQDVSTSAGAREKRPFAVAIGPAGNERVVVMWYDASVGQQKWRFRVRDIGADTWVSGPADLFATATTATDLHATKDSTDTLWVALVNTAGAVNDIQVLRLTSAGAVVDGGLSTPSTDKNPFVLVDRNDTPWLFWVSTSAAGTSSIMYTRRTAAGAWELIPASGATPAVVSAAIPGLPGTYVGNGPVAVQDADGAIWVFWDYFLNPGGNKDIWYARLDPVSGVWTGSRPTTGTAEPDQSAFALSRGDGVIWLFWNRVLAATAKTELFFRQLITTV